MERLNSGDERIIIGTILSNLNIGLMNSERAHSQKAEETRKDFNIVLVHQDIEVLYLRALQGHSGRNLIEPSLQFRTIFRVHLAHRMCNQFTLYILNSVLIPGQNLSKRQTVFFTLVDLLD